MIVLHLVRYSVAKKRGITVLMRIIMAYQIFKGHECHLVLKIETHPTFGKIFINSLEKGEDKAV